MCKMLTALLDLLIKHFFLLILYIYIYIYIFMFLKMFKLSPGKCCQDNKGKIQKNL